MPFDTEKIVRAIGNAIVEVTMPNQELASRLAGQVVAQLEREYDGKIPGVENIQDIVENTLIKENLADVAKAFILYREHRAELRRYKEFFGVKDDLKLGVNAVRVLERRYLLRNEKGEVEETPSQLFRRVARIMAEPEERHDRRNRAKLEEAFYRGMANLEFMPNTPTLMNAGAPMGQLSACFVLPIPDSLSEIFDTLKLAALTHQSGGGTGFDFSRLRPKGDLVRGSGGIASGPISFMKIFDTVTDVIKQGGKRRGANMGILRVDHPDILEFITLKSDPTQLRNFNVSVAATTKFMRAARFGGVYTIVNPRTGRKVRSEDARQMFDLIVSYAWKTGDPGIIFIDEINRRNPTRHIGLIESTNPCGEVPLHPYESCNLASVNLTKFVEGQPTKGKMDWERLRESVRLVVRFLDNLIDMNKFPSPEIEKMTKANRRIGLGVMGFSEALILMGIRYDSLSALAMAARIMSFIEKEGHRMSQELGRSRGSFPNFRGSLWERKGYRAMRNATVTTIAPTGTISIITGCSSGIEPLFAVSFVRNVMEGTRLLEANKIFEDISKRRKFFSADLLLTVAKTGSVQGLREVPKDIQRLFRTALEIPPVWHVRMQAVFQQFTDNAVSKTINLPEDATSDDVRAAYLLAYKLKCKGITIYRYGSKPDQVLSIGALEKGAEDKHVTVDSEFAGGCPAGVCAYATT